MIVIVYGLPGSGKSYLASRLADSIHSAYVNSDRVRKELFAKRDYTDQEKKAVYKEMLKEMNRAIDQNYDLILDATFHQKQTRELFIKAAEGKETIFFIEVVADEAVIKERLKKERPFSEADYEVYRIISQKNEPLSEPHLILQSTNDNIDEMLQKAVAYLKIEK